MRAFISIDLPNEVKNQIVKIQSQLPEFYGKKTETENLHLTLKFLGEIDEDKSEKIKEKLGEIKFNKFQTEIDSIGIFSPKFVKIIWLHLSNCEDLQKRIDDGLKDLFPQEKRFMSHLTIARVKSIKNRNDFLKKINEIKIEPIKFSVDNFRLKKSTLTEKGPKYDTLEEYKLN